MNTEIASKLLALRKQNGFSQEELAEKLGVSRQAVSKWERGDASPDTENLIALAKIYGISLDRLFGLETETVSERSVINLEKKNENFFRENEGSVRVMYPENSASEEIFNSSGQKTEENFSEKPYKEAEVNYGQYFKYETVDDNPEPENSDTGRKSKTEEFTDAYRGLEDKIRNDSKFYKKLMKFPYPVAVTALYMYFGAIWNLWHPMWMAFLTIPLYYTGIQAIKRKNANIFCYPVAVVLLYLIAGFALKLWHPGWLAFLTIPLYYCMINMKNTDKA